MKTILEKNLPIMRVLIANCNQDGSLHILSQDGKHKLNMTKTLALSDSNSFNVFELSDGAGVLIHLAQLKSNHDSIVPISYYDFEEDCKRKFYHFFKEDEFSTTPDLIYQQKVFAYFVNCWLDCINKIHEIVK